MKRILSMFFTIWMLLSLCACAAEQPPQVATPTDAEQIQPVEIDPAVWERYGTVQQEAETVVGAAEAKLTWGQEQLLVTFMDRYYESLSCLTPLSTGDLCSTTAEAKFQECVWKSICYIRSMAEEDLSLTDYSYTLTVEDVQRPSSYRCVVTVIEDNVQYFAAFGGMASEQWTVKHTFELVKMIDRWAIEHHTSDDGPYYNTGYDEKTGVDRNLGYLAANIFRRRATRGAEETLTTPNYDHPYNRLAAKEFMLSHVTERDRRFNAYDDHGGNCMNFGSQTLLAGGIPQDEVGIKSQRWYNYGGGTLSVSFINVGYFLDYAAANTGYGLVAQVGVNYYTGAVGDILTVGILNPRSHTTVICGVVRNDAGETVDYLVCSNTANLRNFPAGAYYSTNQQVTHILGWND